MGVATPRLVRLLDRYTVNASRFGDDLCPAGQVRTWSSATTAPTGDRWRRRRRIEGNGGNDPLSVIVLRSCRDSYAVTGAQQSVIPILVRRVARARRDGAAAGEDDIIGGSNVVHRDVQRRDRR